jgi:hypothetical protein
LKNQEIFPTVASMGRHPLLFQSFRRAAAGAGAPNDRLEHFLDYASILLSISRRAPKSRRTRTIRPSRWCAAAKRRSHRFRNGAADQVQAQNILLKAK